jgi:hypothetical protein
MRICIWNNRGADSDEILAMVVVTTCDVVALWRCDSLRVTIVCGEVYVRLVLGTFLQELQHSLQ